MQASLGNFKETRMPISETNDEENVLDIVSIVYKEVHDQDSDFFKYEGRNLMWKCLYYEKMNGERRLSKEALIFEEVVQILEKACVTDKKNLITKELISLTLSFEEVECITTGRSDWKLI